MADMQTNVNKRKRYAADFKQQAVEKLNTGNYTLRELSAELHVSVPTLLKWRGGGAAAQLRQSEDASEIAALRREIVRLTEERDRLRKGIALLAGISE
jgi:transposase